MNQNNTFQIEVAGCKRNLPVCQVNEHISIAAFVMFGDVEITEKCATELLKICPDFDILVTAESKGIPLCYEMARQSRKDYIVARKAAAADATTGRRRSPRRATTSRTV